MDEVPEYVGPTPLPGEPTDALPGSERKIRILVERAARKEPLFHPLDGVLGRSYPHLPTLTEESA